VALALHGAAWITLKSADPFVARLRVFQRRTWWTLALLLVASFAAVYVVRPDFFDLFLERLLARGLVPLAALGALAILPTWLARKAEGRVFVSSSLFIAGMLAATAIAIHPVLLRSTNPEHPDLTIAQAASPGIAQSAALGWWPLGLVLALAYLVFAHRTFKGKIAADENIYGGH
jgi:cytochrome bd-type quinol oxidase subunit 2